nr:hypothetical protein [Tanacetum cinerariifolium]
MTPEYENEELTINPTQDFSVHNLTLKPNQPEELLFIDHIKAICNLDVLVDSKAPKHSSQTKEETKFGSAKDKSLCHPLPPTLVVSEMHKEAQQAAGGPTYLGATNKEGAHSQLSSGHDASAHSTAEADPGISAHKDFLEDLSDILKDTRSAFFTLDSPPDEPIIVSDESKEEEKVARDKDTEATSHDVPKDTLIPPHPSLKFATMVENASGATSMNVPSAGKATALPADGEKYTKDADTSLKDESVDHLGKNVVTQYYTKKLLFDKYCDKMLKRKKNHKITKCEVLTKKGPIALKIYREDGSDEVILNLRASDLHLGEWRETLLDDTLGAATLTSRIDTLKAIVKKIAKTTNNIYSNRTFRGKEEKKELMHSEKEEDQ